MKTSASILIVLFVLAIKPLCSAAERYPGILDSFEKFRGNSGESVANYRGDDAHTSWTRTGNAFVIKDAPDAYEGRNFLRIEDNTTNQHWINKVFDEDYRPLVAHYQDKENIVPYSFAFRFNTLDGSFTAFSFRLRFHNVTSNTFANTGAPSILLKVDSSILPETDSKTNFWMRAEGDLRYTWLNATRARLLLHLTRIVDTRVNPVTGEEKVLWENSGETSHYSSGNTYAYVQFNMDSQEEAEFRLSEMSFFTGGSGKGIVDFDDIRIGEWHDPTSIFLFR